MHAFLRHEYRLRARHQFQVKLFRNLMAKVNPRSTSGAQGPMYEPRLVLRAVPKQCPVAIGGGVLPYQDYLVSGEWVMNLLQQRKLVFASARAEFIKVGENLPRLLQHLEKS